MKNTSKFSFGGTPIFFVLLFSGCAIVGYKYAPTDQDTAAMTEAIARITLQQNLLNDPGDNQPVLLDGSPISSVKVSTRRLVINTAKSSTMFMLKDITPNVYQAESIGTGAYVNIDDKSYFKVHANDQASFPIGIANALYVLKKNAINAETEDVETNFGDVVTFYHSSTVKPTLTEEARKAKVQAEGAVRDKDFNNAAKFYLKALKIAPWWPEGHFNRALVLGEIEDYDFAIVEMKRYLALIPDAVNARAAQDMIYNWERKAEK